MGQDFQEPYIPRMASIGKGETPLSGVLDGLSALNDSVKQIQLSRSVNAANSDIQQMMLNETSQAKIDQAKAQAAQHIGQQAISLGFPATTAQTLQNTFYPKTEHPLLQSIPQIAAYGTPEQQKSALEFLTKYEDLKTTDSTTSTSSKGKTAEDPLKAAAKKQALFSKFSKDVQPDSSARSVLAQALTTQNRAQNLIALMGPDTTVAALNKVQPQFVTEAAASLASMVKNGQVTEGELHQFMPNTNGMTRAKAIQYITNQPESANAGGFLKLYLHAATRESSLNAQTVAESILSKAQGNALLHKVDQDQYKNTVATALNTFAQKSLSPEDIIVEKSGKVTTTEQQSMDKKFKLYSDALGEAKMKLRSKDPKEAEKAQQFFQKLGLEPDFGVSEMKSILKARIRGGMY